MPTQKTLREIIDQTIKQAFDKGLSVMNKNIDENGQFKEKHLTIPITNLRSSTISEIKSLLKEKLPKKEDETKFCKCFTPDINIKMPENLFWCMTCNKQHGATTFNSCLTEIEKILEAL